MKELEKRIADIEKGELEVLYRDHDYAAKLNEQLPELKSISVIIYEPRIKDLLKRVEDLSKRQSLISNKTIRAYDESWEERMITDEKGQEFKLKKDHPDQFLVWRPVDGGSNMTSAHIDDFNEILTKIIVAPDSFVDKIEAALTEEVLTYKRALSLYIDKEGKETKIPLSFGFSALARQRDFLEAFLDFSYYDLEVSKEKKLFIFNGDKKIADVQKEDLAALFKAHDIREWAAKKERSRVRVGFDLGVMGYLFNYMLGEGHIAEWRQPVIVANIFSVDKKLTPTKGATVYSSLSKLNSILKKGKSDSERVNKYKCVINPLINAFTQKVKNHAVKQGAR